MDSQIIGALISLAGIIITAWIAKDSFSKELDKRLTLLDSKFIDLGNDVRESKEYTKQVPIMQEQIKTLDEKVMKHNNLVEKVNALEKYVEGDGIRWDNIRDTIKELKDER